MPRLKSVLSSPYLVWALLCLPAIPMIQLLASDNPRAVHIAVHPSGEFAARFMIIAMIATPLSMLLRGWRGPRWLVKNRRYFGVAAFCYALAHTVLYLIDKGTVSRIVGEIPRVYIWTGWIAMLIFIPLAVTSTDGWVRRLGPTWKWLQRWVYAAAVLTLVHWASLHNWGSVAPALLHFGPLIALSVWRLWWNFLRPRTPEPA